MNQSHDSFIFKLLNTEGWLAFIGNRNIHSLTDASNYIDKINNNTSLTYWVAAQKENGDAVGIITFIQRDYLPHPDIGFAFLPQFTGKGFAYEAAKAILHFIVATTNHAYILATTMPANVSSIRLLEKLGLRFDKTMEVQNEKIEVYRISTDGL